MRCDHSNGYLGWTVVDSVTGIRFEYVLWVDPDAKEFCTMDTPARAIGNEIAKTVHKAQEIETDPVHMRFIVTKAPIVVAPLSRGRQHTPERSDQPCADCRQPHTCRRIHYCAAHRSDFGAVAP